MIDRTKINTEEELGFTTVPAAGGGEGAGKGWGGVGRAWELGRRLRGRGREGGGGVG